MKNNSLKIKNFESDKISKEAQKIIRGGDGEPIDPNNPVKNGGSGNG
ncbi:hypothetical protein [Flavobacterium olei]